MVEERKPRLTPAHVLELVENCDYNAFTNNLGSFPSKTIPQPIEDITEMQMEDVTEKLDLLRKETMDFPTSSSDQDIIYRRLSEACVKYSIALDRVNVIGREKIREERKKMLVEIDAISSSLVEKYEQYKANKPGN